MKMLFLSVLVLPACSYKYVVDTPAIEELRAQQTQTTERMNELEKKQAEQDGKIRVMWTHGK